MRLSEKRRSLLGRLGDGTANGVNQSPDAGAEHPADAGKGGQGP